MTRLEIRRRALRAATAVSLTTLSLGLFGCDGTIEVEAADVPDVDPTPTPTATATAHPTVPILPIMAADAGPSTCPCPPDQDMVECCNAENWSFECGCEAWGPPMPPSMEVG